MTHLRLMESDGLATAASVTEDLTDFEAIQVFLARVGVSLERWQADIPFADDADQETILSAYRYVLAPYMQAHGYQAADVINVSPETPNLPALRAKFAQEHTHTEDEVRFFVAGQGHFWFNLPALPVVCVTCTAGDLLSVPANTRHWFTMDDPAAVKTIRIFTDPSGWTPVYTDANLAAHYPALPPKAPVGAGHGQS
jgi:1,2-dihydroxy-3-keto-5-methylthiopentene dioxygenase